MNKMGIRACFGHLTVMVIGMVFCVGANAYESVILVANSSHFSLLHRIETAIYAQPSPRPQVYRIEAEELIDSAQFDKHHSKQDKLIVALGSRATKAVLETKPDHAILSILIRKHEYESLRDAYTKEHQHPPLMTAVYLDQPFDRQFKLIGTIMQRPETDINIGVLLGPQSLHFGPILEKAAKKYPIKLHIIRIKNQDNVISALDVLLEDVDVILALPDQSIYNSRTARGLLLSAYRKHVPLVGFSRTYVNNGALAAVYSNPKQVANQTAEMIMEIYLKGDSQLPEPRFPDTYSIAVNHQVSRSLSLDIESEDALHYNIQQQESVEPSSKCCVISYISTDTWGDDSE